MTIQETFSEWFRQLDEREQNVLLEYINERYSPKPSPPPAVGSANEATANPPANSEKTQDVCPTCKRGY